VALGKIVFCQRRCGRAAGQSTHQPVAFFELAGHNGWRRLFATLLYGFTNKYNYKVWHVPVQFPNLPAAFKGLRIVQISDIHSGSLTDKRAVQKGVEKIMSLKPDLIVFTGDLVNNKAEEILPYLNVFNQLKAPLGVFSIFGNHDYGDYVPWEIPPKRQQYGAIEKPACKNGLAAPLGRACGP
jgi:hypothetical protein